MLKVCGLAVLLAAASAVGQPTGVATAIYTDPRHDAAHPARLEVLHIPSNGVVINGVAYTAEGAGTHPTVVLIHGFPGDEKNLDLAQAVRRAGWNVVTFNYRGSWGSPGRFSFGGSLQDVRAVLAFVRDPANVRRYDIDTSRIILVGHSAGGWAAAMTAEEDHDVAGSILISGVNLAETPANHARLVALFGGMMEGIAGATPETLATEVDEHRQAFDWRPGAAALAKKPLLVLTADDGLAQMGDELVQQVRRVRGARVSTFHYATDHSWSDARIRLEQQVIEWLGHIR